MQCFDSGIHAAGDPGDEDEGGDVVVMDCGGLCCSRCWCWCCGACAGTAGGAAGAAGTAS